MTVSGNSLPSTGLQHVPSQKVPSGQATHLPSARGQYPEIQAQENPFQNEKGSLQYLVGTPGEHLKPSNAVPGGHDVHFLFIKK